MKSPWVWALVVLVCTLAVLVGGERRISCYKCISSSNATGNFKLKGDGCLDPFNHSIRNQDSIVKCSKEAVGCMKMYRKIDGVEYMKRLCIYSRPKTDDYCDEWSTESAEGIDCYCHKDGCNGANLFAPFFFGIPFILFLPMLQYFSIRSHH